MLQKPSYRVHDHFLYEKHLGEAIGKAKSVHTLVIKHPVPFYITGLYSFLMTFQILFLCSENQSLIVYNLQK